MAHGIAGLLDPRTDAAVRDLRIQLEERFGLRQLRPMPTPHVTLLSFASFDDATSAAIESAAVRAPVSLRADGWMMFAVATAPSAALVRTVSASTDLLSLRATVVEASAAHVAGVRPFMRDGEWTPHITCAAHDLTPRVAGDVFAWLAETSPLAWEGSIDALALLVDKGDEYGLAHRIALG